MIVYSIKLRYENQSMVFRLDGDMKAARLLSIGMSHFDIKERSMTLRHRHDVVSLKESIESLLIEYGTHFDLVDDSDIRAFILKCLSE